MDLVAFFPNSTSVEQNDLMFDHACLEELKVAIYSLKAGNIQYLYNFYPKEG